MILYGLLAVEKAIVRSEADPITALRVRTAVASLLFDEVKDIIRPMKTVTSEVQTLSSGERGSTRSTRA